MDKLKEKLRNTLLYFGGIRYVPTSKKSGFFLIKYPNRLIRRGQSKSRPECLCAIYDYKSLMLRWKDKKVENLLINRRKIIEKSPEFIISSFGDKKNGNIQSAGYSRAIKHLLIEVELIPQNRGKYKSVKATVKGLRNFIKKQYQKAVRRKQKASIATMQQKLWDKVQNEIPNPDEADKLLWSKAQVWRIMTGKIK